MSDQEINVKISAEVQGLLNGMKQAQEQTETAVSGMRGNLGSLIESLEALGPAALVVGAVAIAFEAMKEAVEIGYEAVKDAIEETKNLGESFEKLEAQTGLSSQTLMEMDVAMKMQGGSIDSLDGLIMKMGRSLANASDKYIEHGIAANKAELAQMSYRDVLDNVGEKVAEASSQTEKASLMIDLFGRAGLSAIPVLAKFHEDQGQAAETAKLMGINMDDVVESSHAYERQMGQVDAMVMAFKLSVGKELLPVLTDLIGIAKDYLPPALNYLKEMILGTKLTFIDIVEEVTRFDLILEGMAKVAMDAGTSVGMVFTKAMAGDFKGALEQAKTGWKNVADLDQTYGNLLAANAAEAEIKRATAIANAVVPAPRGKDSPIGSKSKESTESTGEIGQEFKRQIEAQDQAFDDLKKCQDAARKDAADFSKWWIDTHKAQYDAAIKDADNAYKQTESNLDLQVAKLQITEDQKTAALKTAEDKRYAIVLANQQKIADLYPKGTAEYMKEQDKENQIASEHAKKKTDLEIKASKDQKKVWDDYLKQFNESMASGISNAIRGTETWRDALKNVLDQLEDSIIKFFVNWALKALENALIGEATAKTTAVSEASSAAAVWAVNAAASAAAIPVVGWVEAPAAAAAAYAQGMGYAGMASASGGWDRIPHDQIAMVHKDEMVMPAPLATSIRKMAAEGGSGGGGGSVTVHLHASALDGASAHQALVKLMPRVLQVVQRDRKS